jgi:hypothetical protein
MKDDTEVDYVPSRLMYTSKAQILYSSLVFGADRDKKISNWKQDNGTHFNQNKIHSRLNDWKPARSAINRRRDETDFDDVIGFHHIMLIALVFITTNICTTIVEF